MRATDLMIGDYVYIDRKVRKVEQITKKKVGYHTEPNQTHMCYKNILHIRPILIKDFDLSLLGFKSQEDENLGKSEVMSTDVYGISLSDVDCLNGYYTLDCVGIIGIYADVKYIHEVQNFIQTIDSILRINTKDDTGSKTGIADGNSEQEHKEQSQDICKVLQQHTEDSPTIQVATD